MDYRNVYRMFEGTVAKHGTCTAVGFRPHKAKGYTYWTYNEFAEQVKRYRKGLVALGMKKGDRIALIAQENRVEWAITDLAAQSLGYVIVSIYGTLPASQVAYYLKDSGARILIVSDDKQLAKALEIRDDIDTLETIIAMDGEPRELERDNILPFEEVYKLGEKANLDEAALERQTDSVMPEDLATLIYTSGTTGDPKGAMLTHRNLIHTPDFVENEPAIDLNPDDVFLSFLPLSHITERLGGHYLPLSLGATIVYSHGIMALQDELQTLKPTAMLCVPRLFEAMYERVRESIPKLPDKERKALTIFLPVILDYARHLSEGKSIPVGLKLKYAVAEKLVVPKLAQKVMGGRMRNCVSGGAPLDSETALFFIGIGIRLMEGYGLSETGIIALNRAGKQRAGTVGNVLPNVEIKFEEDGEILTRGQPRMIGYWNKPEATADSIDGEGWFHTGDIGEMSADGFLKITDRKKDIIVLTNGKKVAPQPIEAMIKHSPFVQEAVLMGEKQPSVMAVIFPARDKLLEWARSQQLDTHDVEALVTRPEVQKLFKSEIDRHTENLADFERVRRFKVASVEASMAGGEWTPTLKVKRKQVAQKYADLIASMSRN